MTQVEYTGPFSPFGNLTYLSGLAAAFSGADSKPRASCAGGINQSTTPGVIGGTPTDGVARQWSGFRVFGPNASKLLEHDTAVSRTFALFDENNNMLGTASAIDQVGQVWQNMTISAPAPFVSPRVVLQGAGVVNDGADVARVRFYYEDDGSTPPPTTTLPPTTQPPNPPPSVSGAPRDITLSFGQSHDEGPAALEDFSAYRYAAACDNFPQHSLTWGPAVEPLNPVATAWFGSGRMGPTMAYLNERAKLVPGRRQGMLLRARGSTSLSDFAPGSGKYQQIVSDMLAAKNASPAGSRFVGAICWQGESGPSNWDQVFLSIVNAMRVDLSAPNLPFAFVEVDPRWSTKGVQHSMLLPYGVQRVTLDDVYTSVPGDIIDPRVHRVVGERLCWSIMGMSTVAI